MINQPLTLVAFSLVFLLLYFTNHLVSRLRDTGKKVGYVHTDLYVNTLLALGITLVLSLRWPLLMLAVAWLFEIEAAESELATAVYVALSRTALYFWGLEFLRLLVLPKGLAESHFRLAAGTQHQPAAASGEVRADLPACGFPGGALHFPVSPGGGRGDRFHRSRCRIAVDIALLPPVAAFCAGKNGYVVQ